MKFIKKYKYVITIILIIMFVFLSIIIKNKLNKEKYNITSYNEEIELFNKEDVIKEETNKPILCTVDIKGEVNNPGVYTTDCNKYVYDIIKEAGNLTDNADTSVINLAKKITDEMVIIIYTKEEVDKSKNEENITKIIDTECICPKVNNDSCITDNDKIKTILININKATMEELKTLPGIGESKAKAIIEYRNDIGAFKTIEDIKNVKGIGQNLYEEIKEYITT